MKILDRFSTLFLAALLATLVGCAGSGTQKSTGEFIDDAAITTKVKTALIRSDEVDANDVNVETFKGTVQLSGFVDSREQMRMAEDIAEDIEGVRAVQNNLQLRTDY